MLRALSTRNGRGYEKLKEEDSTTLLEAKLKKSRSLPAKVFGSQRKSIREQKSTNEEKSAAKQAKKVSKIHPIFNLFNPSLRKKVSAKPEFSRYLEYLKEGGGINLGTNLGSNLPPIQER